MKRINLLKVLKILIVIFIIETVAFLLSVIIALIYHEPCTAFIWSAVITMLTAVVFYFVSRKEKFTNINNRESVLSVTASWLVICLAGTLPYVTGGSIPSFINAFFESSSGFTTTGSTILVDIEILPKSILFFRSLSHWIGGLGIILLVILILPTLNIGGYRIFTLESTLQEKTHPRLKDMAVRLLFIYILLSVAETILLCAGGMNLFESACHTFGTVATGGFSPKNSSLAGYSPYLQYVVMIFMLLAGMNFLMHYYLLKRKFKKIVRNDELWFYLVFILIAGSLITGILFFKTEKPFETAFRDSFFQVISILTSTGFASSDYLKWPRIVWVLIYFLLFMGACTGSTSGGIKMARHLLLLKNIKTSFKKMVHPNMISVIKLNGNEIPAGFITTVINFMLIYLSVFAVGSLVMMLTGLDAETASSAVLTCMGNIGPGIGTVGPVNNFNHITDFGKVLLSLLMILGRLEIFSIFMVFTPAFWRS